MSETSFVAFIVLGALVVRLVLVERKRGTYLTNLLTALDDANDEIHHLRTHSSVQVSASGRVWRPIDVERTYSYEAFRGRVPYEHVWIGVLLFLGIANLAFAAYDLLTQ